MLILPRDALWALLERALRREATAAAGSNTFREQMLTSRQMPCRQAEAAGRGVPKRSLTGRRRAPGAPAPQQDDAGRCEAQLDPLGALPAFLPARVVADLWVEPDAGAFRLEHPLRRRRSPAGRTASKSSGGGRWRCASGMTAPTRGSSRGRWRSTRRSCPPPPNGGCRL